MIVGALWARPAALHAPFRMLGEALLKLFWVWAAKVWSPSMRGKEKGKNGCFFES